MLTDPEATQAGTPGSAWLGLVGRGSGMGLCGAGGGKLDLAGLEASQALASPADAVACRARELGVGDARWGPRARGERRRHTITNGVDCDLVSKGPGGSGGLSILPGFGLGPQTWPAGPPLCPGGDSWFRVLGDSVAGTSAVLNLSPHPALNPLAGRPVARSGSPLGGTFGPLLSTALAPACFPAMVGRPSSRGLPLAVKRGEGSSGEGCVEGLRKARAPRRRRRAVLPSAGGLTRVPVRARGPVGPFLCGLGELRT